MNKEMEYFWSTQFVKDHMQVCEREDHICKFVDHRLFV